jgi:predicted cupin superfamily sugar epimerase
MVRIAGTFIDKLRLLPHPEGGYYRETYRASEVLPAAALPPRYGGARAVSTAIYFLLADDQRSALHRLRSDEAWHFYAGSALLLSVIHPDGRLERITLGPDFDEGEAFQAMVPAGTWFGAEVSVADSYALAGCTVAPGFDFLDFETADRATLLQLYPAHRTVIERLTQRAPR